MSCQPPTSCTGAVTPPTSAEKSRVLQYGSSGERTSNHSRNQGISSPVSSASTSVSGSASSARGSLRRSPKISRSGASRRSCAAMIISQEKAVSSERLPPPYAWPWNCDAVIDGASAPIWPSAAPATAHCVSPM
jgi:hypothetical protein